MAIQYSTAQALGALLSTTKIMKAIQSDINDNIAIIKDGKVDEGISGLERIINSMIETISDIENTVDSIKSKVYK